MAWYWGIYMLGALALPHRQTSAEPDLVGSGLTPATRTLVMQSVRDQPVQRH
jgi:hypothetical protein